MAITTGAAIEEFGTQTAVITTAGAVNNTSFSLNTDATTFTNSDDALTAAFVFKGTFSVSPTASSSIDLYAQLLNIQGTNDTPEPSATLFDQYMGSFQLDVTTSEQTLGFVGSLPNIKAGQEYNFFIQNKSGQTLSAAANVYITTTAVNSKA